MGLASSPGFFQHRMHPLRPFMQNTVGRQSLFPYDVMLTTITLHQVLPYRVPTSHVHNEKVWSHLWTLDRSIMLNPVSWPVMD